MCLTTCLWLCCSLNVYRLLRSSPSEGKIKRTSGSVRPCWSDSVHPLQARYSAAPRCGYTHTHTPHFSVCSVKLHILATENSPWNVSKCNHKPTVIRQVITGANAASACALRFETQRALRSLAHSIKSLLLLLETHLVIALPETSSPLIKVLIKDGWGPRRTRRPVIKTNIGP